MQPLGKKMATSTVPVPEGWPSIKATYANITRKLSETATREQKLTAISYWQQRLTEDAGLITNDQGPATA